MLNGMNVGSTATYSCDDSYHLDGLQTRMCQNIGGMGVWSGDPPICEEIIQRKFLLFKVARAKRSIFEWASHLMKN